MPSVLRLGAARPWSPACGSLGAQRDAPAGRARATALGPDGGRPLGPLALSAAQLGAQALTGNRRTKVQAAPALRPRALPALGRSDRIHADPHIPRPGLFFTRLALYTLVRRVCVSPGSRRSAESRKWYLRYTRHVSSHVRRWRTRHTPTHPGAGAGHKPNTRTHMHRTRHAGPGSGASPADE